MREVYGPHKVKCELDSSQIVAGDKRGLNTEQHVKKRRKENRRNRVFFFYLLSFNG